MSTRAEDIKCLQSLIKEYKESYTQGTRVASGFNQTANTQYLINKKHRDLMERLLDKETLLLWDQNPHLRGPIIDSIICDTKFKIAQLVSDLPQKLLKIDFETDPSEQYSKGLKCLLSTVHIGQRKLLVNEILFLTKYGDKANTIVYAGAAPGSHMTSLCDLFPRHKFILYDPAKFSYNIMTYSRKNPNRLKFYNELFPPQVGSRSDRELKQDIKDGFLFISDIRRKDEREDAPTTADILADIKLQYDVLNVLRPKVSHLKLRLPYTEPGEDDTLVDLPVGDIYKQPWAGTKSTETRLVVDISELPPDQAIPMKSYSSRHYEEIMFWHNVHGRSIYYDIKSLQVFQPFFGVYYDGCYDCMFEMYTIQEYISLNPSMTILQVIESINSSIGREEFRLLR